MNKLEVEFDKLRTQIERVCRKKHKNVESVSVNVQSYSCSALIVHVHTTDRQIISYYPNSLRLKQIVQYIRHTNGV